MSLSPTNTQALDRYLQQAGRMAVWAKGLSHAQLIAPPIGSFAGSWTIAQNIVHCLESDLVATHRMRRIVAEEMPLLIAYDETRLASALGYNEDDLTLVCRLFDDNRRWTAAWLRRLSDGAFERSGIHNQRGKVSLGQFVTLYADHIDHHEKSVVAKRAALGVAG